VKHYTISEIIKYSENNNNIEEWVHEFLTTSGNNVHLSAGLKKKNRYWLGPVKLYLNKLHRCCGPEESIEFKISLKDWNKNVSRIVDQIENGYEIAPLLVEFKDNILSIRDGNHRYEALLRSNTDKYWTIIWCNTKSDHTTLLNRKELFAPEKKEL
jgi:hypothetical protein